MAVPPVDVSSANAVTADRGSMVIIMQTATNKLIKRLGFIIFYSFSIIFPKKLSLFQPKQKSAAPAKRLVQRSEPL